MAFQFVITPRDGFLAPQNPHVVNQYLNRLTEALSGWEPIRLFNKQKEYSFAYDERGPGSITIKIPFLVFTEELGDQQIPARAVMNIMRDAGLDGAYYISQARLETPPNARLVFVNNERGYGYPIEYFPELAVQNAPAPQNAAFQP